jgi:hypothetical protein
MMAKVFITLCLAIFGILLPVLEIGPSHVYNPQWPEHARLHEVWQLITNCAFAAFAFWLVWVRNNLRLASGIGLIMVGGFLAAYLLRSTYGGSMRHTDGTELTVLGVNSALLVMAIAAVILTGAIFKNARSGD